MTQLLTEEEAGERLCPLARTFSKRDTPRCMGERCILWRWEPAPANNPIFKAALKRRMLDLAAKDGGKKSSDSFHKQAVADVMAAPEDYGVPPHSGLGWCGLGGGPEK